MNEHAERIARRFHEEYERLAPKHGWQTQERARKKWDELPIENRELMMEVVSNLLQFGIILPGPPQLDPVRRPDLGSRSEP